METSAAQDFDERTPKVSVFKVVPGRVYELRLLLQETGANKQSELSLSALTETRDLVLGATKLTFRFADTRDRTLDLRLAAEQTRLPGLNPMLIETLPPGCTLSDDLSFGALASRFLVPPPDAATLHLGPFPENVVCLRCELRPFGVLWSAPEGERVSNEMSQVGQNRLRLLARHLNMEAASEEVRALICDLPNRQIRTLRKRFARQGDWKPTLEALSSPAAKSTVPEEQFMRQDRMRKQAKRLLRLGFIGSERGFERLAGMAEVYWLREDDYADRIAHLALNLIILETVDGSAGGHAMKTGWDMAFSSATGELPARGASLLAAAKAAGIAVHLWVTATPSAAPRWRACLAAVDRVIVEGQPAAPWSATAHSIPHSSEPISCAPLALASRQSDLLLVPTVSDAFSNGGFAGVLRSQTPFECLVAEFGLEGGLAGELDQGALHGLLGDRNIAFLGCHSRRHEHQVMQAANLVLLPANSKCAAAKVMAIVMDSIASGAIPVLFGSPGKDAEPLIHALPTVHSAVDLMELQSLCRVSWQRERLWRGLMRKVAQAHVWTAAHRESLLGQDPFHPDFDTPRLAAILIADGVDQVALGLATFRKQSWQNKALILILQEGEATADLPVLEPNEQLLIVSPSSTLTECMAAGISAAQGSAWVRIEPEIMYSEHFLQETDFYLRAAQADIVARPATVYHAGAASAGFIKPAAFQTCPETVTTDTILGVRAGFALPSEVWEGPFSQALQKELRLFWADRTASIRRLPDARQLMADVSFVPLGPQGMVARLEV